MSVSEKCFNEVIELVEEFINELNAVTVNNALNKRIDQDIEADEKDRVNFNNILKIKDRDERAKAYKDFKKKYDERNAIIDKRMDRYEAYAKRHPEFVEEAVEKYVDNDGNTHELEFSANKNKYKFDHKINGKSVVSAVDSEPNANYERKHAVKNYGLKKVEEALSLMEEVINEVSMDKWKEAAASSLPKRQEKALKSEEEGRQIWKGYEEASKKSPEDEPSLYRKAEKDAEAHAEEHKKNVDRATHAELVSMLKTKGKSANKTIKAAKKVQDERSEDFYENPNAKTISRKVKASSVATADPVKSRNEVLEEADHHANSKNPVVKITDKNYRVASGKSLPGPFNKNHVGQYIVYNKDTDASYLVTPDNWKKSKIKRDLERQGKFYEALEEAISALLEYTEADKKKAAKKVLDDRKREYLSKYANVLDAADIDGSENVPDGDMKDLERAEKRYEHAKKVANEAFEETLKILELFDRPDLLNDIDTALGSPVKKTFKKAISSVAVPKKEKKVKECKK